MIRFKVTEPCAVKMTVADAVVVETGGGDIEPLTVAASRFEIALPIIGPPETIFAACSGTPPAHSAM